jgi:hypothetical protein
MYNIEEFKGIEKFNRVQSSSLCLDFTFELNDILN